MSFSIITPRPTAEDVAKAITLFDSPSRTRLQTRNSLHIVASTLQHMLGAIGREGREVEARVIRARVSLDTLMQLVHESEIKVTDIAGEMELEWIEQGSLYGQVPIAKLRKVTEAADAKADAKEAEAATIPQVVVRNLRRKVREGGIVKAKTIKRRATKLPVGGVNDVVPDSADIGSC